MCAPNEAEVHKDVATPLPVASNVTNEPRNVARKARNRALLTQGARKHTPGKA